MNISRQRNLHLAIINCGCDGCSGRFMIFYGGGTKRIDRHTQECLKYGPLELDGMLEKLTKQQQREKIQTIYNAAEWNLQIN